jgi:hypothetical protein
LTSSSVLDLNGLAQIYSVAARPGYADGIFTPDNRFLYLSVAPAAADVNPLATTFAVVDLKSGKATGTFQLPGTGPFSMADDATRALCSMDIYEMPSGRKVSSMEESNGLEYFAAQTFLANDRYYRVANRDGVVFTWDTETGKLLSRVKPQALPPAQAMIFRKGGTELVFETRRAYFFYDAGTLHPHGKWTIPSSADIPRAPAKPVRDEIAVNSGGKEDGDLFSLSKLSLVPMPTTGPANVDHHGP